MVISGLASFASGGCYLWDYGLGIRPRGVVFFLIGATAMLLADTDEMRAAASWANAKVLNVASSLMLAVFLLTLRQGRYDLLSLEIGSMLFAHGLATMIHLVRLSVRDSGVNNRSGATWLAVFSLILSGFGLVALTS